MNRIKLNLMYHRLSDLTMISISKSQDRNAIVHGLLSSHVSNETNTRAVPIQWYLIGGY